jgi:hypothetical protein
MGRAWTWLRLSYRQQRWELLLIALAVIGVAGAMLWLTNQTIELRALRDECLAEASGRCDAIVARAYAPTQDIQLLLMLSQLAPFALGVVLGAPLIAREVEGRTGHLAWTMSPSRVRWLIGRVAFVALFLAICLGTLAVTSESAAAILDPERNLARDFNFAEYRGWILVARGLLVLMIAILVGAVVGRLLPGLIAAGVLSAAAFIGFGLLDSTILKGEAQLVRMDPQTGSAAGPGSLYLDAGVQMTDGTVYTWDEVSRRGIQVNYGDDRTGRRYASEADVAAGRAVGHDVAWVVPGDRYPEVTVRRGAMLGFLALVTFIGVAAVVERRRPE